MAEAELAKLRAEIDAIDDQILALLKTRMDVVKRVGVWKAQKADGLCPIRSGREATQLKRVSQTAAAGDFSPAAAAHIWRHIINASLALEGRLKLSMHDDARTQMWSREYFGSYTSYAAHHTSVHVVQDIINNIADVGIAPLFGEHWWLALVNTPVRVFAALPFIADAPTPHAFAFARLHPEPSGNDATLAVFEGKVECTLPYTTFDTAEHYSLIMLESFVKQDQLPSNATVIGAYAKPLKF